MSDKNEPCTYIIFGATGHLSRTKLLPALYHLEVRNRLPAGTTILCVGRSEWTTESWQEEIKSGFKDRVRNGLDEEIFTRFAERLQYLRGDLHKSEIFDTLRKLINEDKTYPPNAAFYMALRPAEFGKVIKKLAEANLTKFNGSWRRVIIEKPFGTDLETAQNLQRQIHGYFGTQPVMLGKFIYQIEAFKVVKFQATCYKICCN